MPIFSSAWTVASRTAGSAWETSSPRPGTACCSASRPQSATTAGSESPGGSRSSRIASVGWAVASRSTVASSSPRTDAVGEARERVDQGAQGRRPELAEHLGHVLVGGVAAAASSSDCTSCVTIEGWLKRTSKSRSRWRCSSVRSFTREPTRRRLSHHRGDGPELVPFIVSGVLVAMFRHELPPMPLRISGQIQRIP